MSLNSSVHLAGIALDTITIKPKGSIYKSITGYKTRRAKVFVLDCVKLDERMRRDAITVLI